MKEKKGRLIPARLILWAVGCLSFFRVPAKLIAAHLSHNERVWENYLAERIGRRKADGPESGQQDERAESGAGKLPYIEDQNTLTDFYFGRERRWLAKRLLGGRPLRAVENACEVIAVYNALLSLAKRPKETGKAEEEAKEDAKEAAGEGIPDFPALLARFERRGISLAGYFGTSFGALIRYFSRLPYERIVLRGRQITGQALENAQAQGYRVCIMMAENKAGDISQMVHTICLTGDEEKNAVPVWTAHNDYEGSRSYEGLPGAVFGYHKGAGRPLGVLLLK